MKRLIRLLGRLWIVFSEIFSSYGRCYRMHLCPLIVMTIPNVKDTNVLQQLLSAGRRNLNGLRSIWLSVVPNNGSPNPTSFVQSFCYSINSTASMLIRAVRGSHRALRRQQVFKSFARRTVTTDAASSHAEREHVPEVNENRPRCS